MTIYALSSGPGLSGIAVIRISGSDTKKVLQNMTFLKLPEAKVATLRKFKNPETKDLIDEGILLWFPGPESYTGCLLYTSPSPRDQVVSRMPSSA